MNKVSEMDLALVKERKLTMGLLVTGIILFILPIIAWFDAGNIPFVEVLATTLFFWIIGIPMTLVGLDKILPKGLWPSSGGSYSSNSESKGHYKTVYHYDERGEQTGYSQEWVKDK